MVLLKDIEPSGPPFVFYTNYGSAKGRELDASGKAAFVLHWKSLRRQIRVRGLVSREEGEPADDYYASRSLKSRLGAWAVDQSQPLSSRLAFDGRSGKSHGDEGAKSHTSAVLGRLSYCSFRDGVLG